MKGTISWQKTSISFFRLFEITYDKISLDANYGTKWKYRTIRNNVFCQFNSLKCMEFDYIFEFIKLIENLVNYSKSNKMCE